MTGRLRHVAVGLIAVAGLLIGPSLQAHPLGQNAFNREAAIVIAPDRIRLDYLLDLAEIPTLAAGAEADVDRNGQISDSEWAAHAAQWAHTLPSLLKLDAGGEPLVLTLDGQQWAVAPGESGLSQLRLLAHLSAPLALGVQATALDYRDGNPERLGWREVSISAEAGVEVIASDVPALSRTRSMSDFTPRPEGPPAVLSAHAAVRLAAAGAPASGPPVQLDVDARAGSAAPRETAQRLGPLAFFKLGVHHIAIGWDHLVFLLGLVLLSANLKKLAWTVTAFTIAHSVTLGLASQGLVQPPGNWVEALIAATIAWVGMVALRSRTASHGPLLAFGFGLIHGFGFAGALGQTLGADRELTLVGLLSFNLGIECFQLLLVAAVAPALALLGARAAFRHLHATLAAAVLLSGAWWFFERTVGGLWLSTCAAAAVLGAILLAQHRRRVAAIR